MLNFHYKARNKAGILEESFMEADNENAVANRLRQLGLLPVEILEVRGALDNSQLQKLAGIFKNVKPAEINIFTRQLFALQKAGIPLIASLRALRAQLTNKTIKQVIESICRDIEGGMTFSGALSRHPRIFSKIYVSMVRAGEVSGRLPEILDRLAILGENDEKVRMKMNNAMRYPLIVVSSLILAFIGLVTFIVPRFEKLYDQFTVELPLATKALLFISYTVTKFWWTMPLIVVALYILFQKIVSMPQGRYAWDLFRLKVPVFGPLLHKLVMSRFARLTGSLTKSGIPILQVMDLVAESVDHAVMTKVLKDIKVSVNEGKGMAEPMRQSKMFTPIVVQMVETGEETGKLDELLLYISDYLDAEVDYAVSNLLVLVEPLLLVFMGGGILFLALGIFTPMWGMMKLFRH